MTDTIVSRAAPRRIRPTTVAGLRYSAGLDGLRGVAVVAVIAYHSESTWAVGGFLGVEVFFALSGYLVTSLLAAEIARRGRVDVLAFYRARGRRLLPALLICVFGTLAGYGALFGDGPTLRGDALASLGYVQNWHLVLGHVPYAESFDRPSPLLHLWSLGVEGQLYLLWPLALVALLGVLRPKPVAIVAGLLAALSTLGMAVLYDPYDVGRAYYGTDTRASGFLIGAGLALLLIQRPGRAPIRPALGAALDLTGGAALIGLVYLLVRTSEFNEGLYTEGGFAITGLLTAVVIAAAVRPRGRMGKVLGIRPLRWLGQRSYGIYLYHWPIFLLARPGIDVHASPVVVNIARVAATLITAELSYRLVERPIRRGAIGRITAALRRRTRIPPMSVALLGTCCAVAGVLTLSCGPAVPHAEAIAVSSPSPSPSPAPAPAAAAPVRVVADAALVVGDSVVLGSADALRAALGPDTTVDGAVGRQFNRGPAIVSAWTASHPGVVIVHLGSNGTIRDDDLQAILDAARGRRVVLVNVAVPRPWQATDNETLSEAAARNPAQVVLVDWASAVAAQPSLLGPDQVHPTIQGRTVFAAAIRSALEH